MEVTAIYVNGEMIGCYRSRKKALEILLEEIMDTALADFSREEILEELNSNGSFNDFWYFDTFEVDMED